MAAKLTKKNNFGRGFYYEFADGYTFWALGMSAQEKKRNIAEHGRLISETPA